ncbi:transposase [Fodinibius salsisoli]|uniref:Transposase n=1 Tax=Fodinibius salsisoli TaxID=2820877 RepID=A0ABT3PQP0_9BACT|nr:transposase [Fodinibius salsisoli]MCW9708150.1 transposase [Fodinibius salsisoli]
MEKYKDKYRSDSLRLQGYDYSSAGLYFITICTKNRISCFGKVENGRMNLNAVGHIAADEWQKTAKIRDRVILGEWVVMPNHLHGIIYLKPTELDSNCRDASHHASQNKTDGSMVQTGDGRGPSLPDGKNNHGYKNEFGPQRDNISSIVRGFKSSCTRKIRTQSYKSFAWQKGFYDHIVRNQKALIKIEEYIRENPYRWHKDRYYC